MESIYRALIESILYIATRDVPDDIEDDDVRALETIYAELQSADEAELSRFAETARQMKEAVDDPGTKQALDELIENLTT